MVTRYRDLQRPTLLQTGIVDNSAEQKAMALAGAFRGFGRATSGILGDLNAQQGQQQGAVEGAAGKPQPKTGWRALTRFGESYNSAAEVTYSNKLQTDIHERLGQLEMESEADPVKYAALSEAYRDELVKTVPPEYAPRIGQLFDARLSAGNLRISEQAVQKTQRTALASYLESQPTRIASALEAVKGLSREDGDLAMGEVIAEDGRQIEAFPWLDPVQKLQLEQSFIKDLDAAVAGQRIGSVVEELGQAARVDVVEADRLMAELESDDQYTDDEKTEIRGKVRQQRELLEYERSRLHYKRAAALTQRLARDEYGVGVEREAEQLYRMGVIGDAEYRSYMGRSAENADRVIKANAAAEAAEKIIYTGGEMVPGNAKHEAAVNTAFSNRAANAGMVEGDPRWVQAALQVTLESNILPKVAEEWARKSLVSNDPVRASQAAGLLAQIEEHKPAAFEWAKDPKASSLSRLLQSNINAGLPLEEAYGLAHARIYDVKPEERAIRDEEFNTLVEDNPLDADLEKAFTEKVDWWFDRSPPPLPPSVRAEANSLARQYYTVSGDDETARKMAVAQVRKGWGVTRVNGEPEYTRYPLEQTYGLSSDFIQADVAEQMKPYTDRPVRIEQGPTTNRTRGMDWAVKYQREDGYWDVLRDQYNQPAVYSPPLRLKEFDDSSSRIAAANAEKLRREREKAKQDDALREELLRQTPNRFMN